MKPLTPTPYELGREAADKQEAALVKQAIADRAADKQRIRELEAALKPFAHPDLCKTFGGNVEGDESIVFQRAGAVLKLGHFRRAAAILKGAK